MFVNKKIINFMIMMRGNAMLFEVKKFDGFVNDEASYAVVHIHEGIVSIWDSLEFAELEAEELEYLA